MSSALSNLHSTYVYNKSLARNVNLNQQQKPYFIQRRFDFPKQSPITTTGFNKGDGADGDQVILNPKFRNPGMTSGAHTFRPMVTKYGFKANMNRPRTTDIIDPSMKRTTMIYPKVPQFSTETKITSHEKFKDNIDYPVTAKTGFQNILPIEIPRLEPADPIHLEATRETAVEKDKEAIENSTQNPSVKPAVFKLEPNKFSHRKGKL